MTLLKDNNGNVRPTTYGFFGLLLVGMVGLEITDRLEKDKKSKVYDHRDFELDENREERLYSESEYQKILDRVISEM